MRRARAHSMGFSLMEVMVSMVVLSVGLLGIAKMQALALSSTTTARMRSLAALEAASIASTMRADRAYWSAVTKNPGVLIKNGALDATTADDSLKATSPDCLSHANLCSAARVAGKDVQDWAGELNQQVPGATATIGCALPTPPPGPTPTTCTITITWTEKQVASNAKQANAAATPTTTSYTLYVVP